MAILSPSLSVILTYFCFSNLSSDSASPYSKVCFHTIEISSSGLCIHVYLTFMYFFQHHGDILFSELLFWESERSFCYLYILYIYDVESELKFIISLSLKRISGLDSSDKLN